MPRPLIAVRRLDNFAQVRRISMSHARHHRAVVNIEIGSALDNQETSETSFHTSQRVIHDRIAIGGNGAFRIHGPCEVVGLRVRAAQ